ncbi:hypothetical protein DL93DRAFT_2084693 [Clavulina sp. PMI_390]|nr:hypothetical protein DL93DRAFT_2084693 [Clavulina sp. PMI_390]
MPGVAQAFIHMTKGLILHKQYILAEEILHECIEIMRPMLDAHPQHASGYGALIFSLLASVFEMQGRAEEAFKYYKLALPHARTEYMRAPNAKHREFGLRLAKLGSALHQTALHDDESIHILHEAVMHLHHLPKQDEVTRDRLSQALAQLEVTYHCRGVIQEPSMSLKGSLDLPRDLYDVQAAYARQVDAQGTVFTIQDAMIMLNDEKGIYATFEYQ